MIRVSFLASGTLCDHCRGVTIRLSTRRDSRGWCQDDPRFLLFWDNGTALLFCAVFFSQSGEIFDIWTLTVIMTGAPCLGRQGSKGPDPGSFSSGSFFVTRRSDVAVRKIRQSLARPLLGRLRHARRSIFQSHHEAFRLHRTRCFR